MNLGNSFLDVRLCMRVEVYVLNVHVITFCYILKDYHVKIPKKKNQNCIHQKKNVIYAAMLL